MESKDAVTQLAALAHENRLAVFRLLVQNGPNGLCVGDIAANTGMAPATLSFHLKELSRSGLLRASPDGRRIFYAPDFKAMNALMAYLLENCCDGADCGAGCLPTQDTKA
ncbi:metalloregulator ArsR/SmtB family transcription factor [Algiphilus sp. W345]|uniref:Metalloregulator ArsR/SmtB family transcription factor n=1 Tax=Banduia mediterranea TaxID=3075609 RepID=A0ABU2WLH9_9GAMM|nr:metalloregulator ArsR/SmtB family transcription factor [Algiphilus sp. W345]MDT0498738.1 metalloregulator ArsR/SmtB family transcription factor [Algiphilus sp. W345]